MKRPRPFSRLIVPMIVLACAFPRWCAAGDSGAVAAVDLRSLTIEELMDTKVTSVTKYPESLQSAAASVQVITSDEIRRSGYTTIADVLRLADNLNVAQKNPHDWAISARGFNANVGDKMLVLMDGRSVYTPLFAGVFWNTIDYVLEDIERIEVISGPGGTLWGANAVNGVINIITKNARDTQGTFVELGTGSELQKYAGLRFGMALSPTASLRVYGKYADYDAGSLPDGSAASDAWRQGQAGFRIDGTAGPDDSYGIQGDYYGGQEDLQGLGPAKLSGGNLVGHWSHQLANDSEVSAVAYFDRTHLSDPFGATPFQPAGTFVDNLNNYSLELQHRFWIGETQQLVWGAGFRLTDDHVEQQAPNFGFFPAHLSQDLYHIFAQDEIQLDRNLVLTLGAKFEHNDYTGWEFQPNIRLRWQVDNDHTLWTAVSRAVRTPSRYDRDLSIPAIPPGVITGSEYFASERVTTAELGYRGKFGDRWAASVTFFYNEYYNLRGLSPTPVTFLPLYYSNSVEGRTHGAEVWVDFAMFNWWSWHAGYARLDENLYVKPGMTDFQNAMGETADPQNQFSLRTAIDLPHDFEFNAFCRWVDPLVITAFNTPGTVPGYCELDARLAWHPSKAWEISLVGRNLLHSQHPEYGSPGPQREELQRAIFAKVAWKV